MTSREHPTATITTPNSTPSQSGRFGSESVAVFVGMRTWINRNRRLAKDFEATIASARAFLYAASVMLLVRRLARAS